jgi:hypothetical protein
MEIPVCPGCGGSSWESVEDHGGGSKRYELRAHGWTLVNDWLDLHQTDYRCCDCGYDPTEGEGDGELWDLLNDIDTAPTAETESRPLAEGLSLPLWEGDRTAA